MERSDLQKLNKRFIQEPDFVKGNIQSYLSRIDWVEDTLNAFVTVTAKEILQEGDASKKRYAGNNQLGLLDGSVCSIKDVICTKDIRTTASSKMLEEFIPPYDATVVQKLKDAGAIIIGKNNCDAWAHGASTENSDFGVTPNPWDLSRVSGGSSGGSAASVAACECDFSIGSDTGGSIRQPAGFCGVVGMKPTYGRVSRYGLIAMASSLDSIGPITRNVKDNAEILKVIAGKDKKDSTSMDFPVDDYLKNIDSDIRGKKIGWVKEYYEMGIDKSVSDAMLEARKVFEKLGAEFIEITLPHISYGVPAYYIIQPAEVSSNLGRYDGIKYGYSTKESSDLIDHYFKSRDEGFGDEAKRRIMLGTFVLSAGYYDAYYNKAMKVRTLIKEDFKKAFEKVDVILSPVSPTTAFKIGENTDDPLKMYLADIYTAVVNLAGNPALSVPCGFDSNNLPIGMQIIGKHFDEAGIYNFAYKYEQETLDLDWRKKETVV
jgi:aspartyl-tRNA(Asn)/glutamyl-tRNA(Gln) amidotransferase subunit A